MTIGQISLSMSSKNSFLQLVPDLTPMPPTFWSVSTPQKLWMKMVSQDLNLIICILIIRNLRMHQTLSDVLLNCIKGVPTLPKLGCLSFKPYFHKESYLLLST